MIITSGRSWIFCFTLHRHSMLMLVTILVLSSVSPVLSEEKTPKEPMSAQQIAYEFITAKSENRPVKIEGRIIEGSALDYLNDNLSEGPGVHIEGCKIKGDLNFVKHAKSIGEVRDGLDEDALKHLAEVEARRVEVVGQEIRILKSEIEGSLVGTAFPGTGADSEWGADVAIFKGPISIGCRDFVSVVVEVKTDR